MQLAQRLGGAEQQLAAGDLLRRAGREVLVGLGGLGEAPGREVEVRVDPAPARGVVRDQAVRGGAEPRGEIVERRHRRLRVPELERAHVGLRVPVARELLLGHAHGDARGTDPAADGTSEGPLVDHDPAALPRGDGLHDARSYDAVKSWSTMRASTCAKNADIGTSMRRSISSSAASDGTVRPCSTADTKARVRGAPSAAWVSPRRVRSSRSSEPSTWRHSGEVAADRRRRSAC